QSIIINDKPLIVQETVNEFSKYSARGKHETLLFVDAICIDQSNNSERNY
ncbi:hypothetical protein K431DRAFT_222915, partial [Polychaeton citri CBS 116435]